MSSELKLLLCDSDGAYVKALVAYMISSRSGLTIATYSNEEAFCEDTTSYEIAVLGDGFIEHAKEKEKLQRVVYLSGMPGASYDGYETIYKFQDMHTFLGRLLSMAMDIEKDRHDRVQAGWTGIYSPIHHELQLPFALSCARQLSEEGSVLFLDLEENSILGEFIDTAGAKNLMDCLYLLENNSDNPYADIAYYEGISYLAPMPCFADLSEIDSSLWEKFFASIPTGRFDHVIILFDGVISGMLQAFPYLRELILLTKPGDFYKKSSRRIDAYLSAMGSEIDVNNQELAMSGRNLVDGTYRFEQLLSGNLGRFVKGVLNGRAANV